MSYLLRVQNWSPLLLSYLFLSVTFGKQCLFYEIGYPVNIYLQSLYPFDGLSPLFAWYLLETFGLNSTLSTNSCLFSAFLVHCLTFSLCESLLVRYVSCRLQAVVSCISVSEVAPCNWLVPFYNGNVYFSVSPGSILLCWEAQVMNNLPLISWLRTIANYTRIWLKRTSPGNSELGILVNGKTWFSPLR